MSVWRGEPSASSPGRPAHRGWGVQGTAGGDGAGREEAVVADREAAVTAVSVLRAERGAARSSAGWRGCGCGV